MRSAEGPVPGAQPMELRQALARLSTRRPDLAFDVRWHGVVGSTMDVAAGAAAAGAEAGLIVVAEAQTSGRGRRGHRWESPAGAGLYFSYLARPQRHMALVTLAAGVAVVDGIAAATGLRAHLKWPNDVLVGSRKLAGVLAEGMHMGSPDASVVVGVGLNLVPAGFPPELTARATDFRTELGRDVPRFEVLAAVIERLHDVLDVLESGRAGDILQRWRAASPLAAGTSVRWSADGLPREGVTAGVDEAGALLVRTAAGVERVIAGELAWDLPPG